jgi:hypothetical protein
MAADEAQLLARSGRAENGCAKPPSNASKSELSAVKKSGFWPPLCPVFGWHFL